MDPENRDPKYAYFDQSEFAPAEELDSPIEAIADDLILLEGTEEPVSLLPLTREGLLSAVPVG